MLCIFCLKEHPASDEHVFPLSIGGNLITKRVCSNCNSRLGSSVDTTITEHPLILMRRSQLRLSGNSGDIPDVFKTVFGVGNLASDPNKKIQAFIDPKTGKIKTKQLYNSIDIQQENGSILRQISIDASDAEQLG